MRILILDVKSNGLDLALRCRAAGHEVQWYDQPDKKNGWPKAGHGMFRKIQDYDDLRRRWLWWADLVVCMDNAIYLEMLQPYRMQGVRIWGCTPENVKLELDRDMGQKAMAKAGMQVIPTKRFYSYTDAITFVKKNPQYLVSKPSGDAAKTLSYVAHDAGDLVFMLEKWSKKPELIAAARKYGFILQEKKKGCEMAAGAWFGPGGFGKWICENWEYKKFMNDDLGMTTGEQGTLARCVTKSKLADQVVFPLEEQLHKIGYVGYVDVNCIIDEDGPWPLEFTLRDGCPVRYNMTALRRSDPAQYMLDLIEGRDTQDFHDDVSVSVVVSIPHYPVSDLTAKEVQGFPLYNLGDDDNVHLVEVMQGVAPTLVGSKVVDLPCIVTSSDYVYVATGRGQTITGARRSAYSTIKRIKIPNSPQYRTDIGSGRFKQQLPIIQASGYAKGLSY